MHFQRNQCPIALAYGGRADELAGSQIINARPADSHHKEIVLQLHGLDLTVVSFDRKNLAVQLLDRAADSHRRVGRGLSDGHGRHTGNH